jgi:hypothetical protein
VEENKAPEAWIGKEVVVVMSQNAEPVDGPLLEVNDRGVVLRVFLNFDELAQRWKAGEDREALLQEANYTHVFFPWSSIGTVSVKEEYVVEEDKPGA